MLWRPVYDEVATGTRPHIVSSENGRVHAVPRTILSSIPRVPVFEQPLPSQ